MGDIAAELAVQQEVRKVLTVLARAQQLFGADCQPPVAARFANPATMEDDLGLGYF